MRSPYCFAIDGKSEAEYNVQAHLVNGELGEIIEEVANETGATLIDLHSQTLGKEDLYTDGIHFKAEGYTLISDIVYDSIKDAMK